MLGHDSRALLVVLESAIVVAVEIVDVAEPERGLGALWIEFQRPFVKLHCLRGLPLGIEALGHLVMVVGRSLAGFRVSFEQLLRSLRIARVSRCRGQVDHNLSVVAGAADALECIEGQLWPVRGRVALPD